MPFGLVSSRNKSSSSDSSQMHPMNRPSLYRAPCFDQIFWNIVAVHHLNVLFPACIFSLVLLRDSSSLLLSSPATFVLTFVHKLFFQLCTTSSCDRLVVCLPRPAVRTVTTEGALCTATELVRMASLWRSEHSIELTSC